MPRLIYVAKLVNPCLHHANIDFLTQSTPSALRHIHTAWPWVLCTEIEMNVPAALPESL
jgi:hypothetical protein